MSPLKVLVAVIAAVVLLPVVSTGSCFAVVYCMLNHNGAKTLAVARAAEDERVVEALGTPVESGSASGEIDDDGDRGHAELNIPVEGPKAEGVLLIEADRAGETWTPTRLELHTGAQTIDLLR